MNRISLRNSAGTRGFTLVEIVLVIALLGLMGSILYGTLNGIIRGKNTVLAQKEKYRTARYLVERLNRELNNRVPERLTDFTSTSGRNTARSTKRTYIFGQDKSDGKIDFDSIRFVSAESAQDVVGSSGNRGLVEIEYRLEENPDAKTGELIGDSWKPLILVREEVPAKMSDIELARSKRVVFPVAENVVSLNFRYWSNDKWLDSWEKEVLRFPEVVEVRFKVVDDRGGVETFFTAIALDEKSQSTTARDIYGGSSG